MLNGQVMLDLIGMIRKRIFQPWVSVNAAHVKPFEPLLNGCDNLVVANG